MASGTARRLDRRVSMEAPVSLQFAGAGTHEGQTINISSGGMFVQLREPQPVGSLIKFALALGDEAVEGYGEVLWMRVKGNGPEAPRGVGVQFRHLVGTGQDVLRKCVPGLDGPETQWQ